jgi:hypothetical protein
MHDPADDPAIVYALDAAYIPRQKRLNSTPLVIAQLKQILAHGPDLSQNESGSYSQCATVNEF